MRELLRKLSSRKLWAAAAGMVMGISMVFGLDESVISTAAGAVVALASVAAYIVTEGRVDAESVRHAIDAARDAADALRGADEK